MFVHNIPSGGISHCWAIHAEENAIIQAARHGISIKGSILFCTNKPCHHCLQMCINAGITEVVYKNEYQDVYTADILRYTNLQMTHLQEDEVD